MDIRNKRLLAAVQNSDINAAKKELDYGASPDATSHDGKCALTICSRKGDCDMARLLLDYGARVDKKDFMGNTPLMRAATKGCVNTVRLLISAGANTNAANSRGDTPLMWAVAGDNAEVLGELLFHGADINAMNAFGITAFSAFASKGRWGNKDMLDIFLKNGISVDFQRQDGDTELTFALKNGDEKAARRLLSIGADVNKPDSHGTIPLRHASRQGLHSLAAVMLSNGAVLGFDKQERKIQESLIGGYIESGNVQALKILRESGIDTSFYRHFTGTPLKDALYGKIPSFRAVVEEILESTAKYQDAFSLTKSLAEVYAVNPGLAVSFAEKKGRMNLMPWIQHSAEASGTDEQVSEYVPDAIEL